MLDWRSTAFHWGLEGGNSQSKLLAWNSPSKSRDGIDAAKANELDSEMRVATGLWGPMISPQERGELVPDNRLTLPLLLDRLLKVDEHPVLELSFQTLLTTTTGLIDCLLRPKLVEVDIDPAPILIAPVLPSISSSPVEGMPLRKVIQSTVLTNSHGVATATGVHLAPWPIRYRISGTMRQRFHSMPCRCQLSLCGISGKAAFELGN
ncbi:hypothetical protein VNO77_46337 [Canavalia gladiata]|uniref:Uncharacterized protein n=1 Tax=Canavalia gladiata TaxID=3824 RepID=A0AAN9JD49_CANGL